jgi:predicted PurR-regulated permease PerM
VPEATSSNAAAGPPPRQLLLVELDWRPVAAVAAVALALVAGAVVLGSVPRTLTYLVIGALLALALDPVVGRLAERLGGRRRAAVGVVLLALLLAVVVVGAVLGPETIRQGRNLQQDIPRTVDQLGDLPLVGDTLAGNDVPEKVEDWIDDLPERFAGNSTALEDAATSAANMMIAGFVTLLFTVTLLLDGQRFVRGVRRLVPRSHRPRADELGRLLYRVIGRYFAGSAFVAILHGLFVLVVGLLLGIPLTPLLALWATVFNLVPQIGGLVAGVPFVLLALTQGLLTGIIAAVLFVLYLNLENHIITPVVVGKAVDLSPIATMGGAIVGVSVAGVPGALVAVPFLGAAKAVYRELRGQGPKDEEPDEHLPGSGLLHRLRSRLPKRRVTPDEAVTT